MVLIWEFRGVFGLGEEGLGVVVFSSEKAG